MISPSFFVVGAQKPCATTFYKVYKRITEKYISEDIKKLENLGLDLLAWEIQD